MIKEISFKTHMLILLDKCNFYKTILFVEQKIIRSVDFPAAKCYCEDVIVRKEMKRKTGMPAEAGAGVQA